MPPTHWLMPVARAAPATLHRNTPTKRASRNILVTPALMVARRPSFGRSAAIRKLWNTFCSMNVVIKQKTMRP